MSIKVNYEKNFFAKCHAHNAKKGKGSYDRKRDNQKLKNDLKRMSF